MTIQEVKEFWERCGWKVINGWDWYDTNQDYICRGEPPDPLAVTSTGWLIEALEKQMDFDIYRNEYSTKKWHVFLRDLGQSFFGKTLNQTLIDAIRWATKEGKK